MDYVENLFIGTAWLSSVRVVKCYIQLLNERNLFYKFYKFIVFEGTYFMLKNITYFLYYYKANG